MAQIDWVQHARDSKPEDGGEYSLQEKEGQALALLADECSHFHLAFQQSGEDAGRQGIEKGLKAALDYYLECRTKAILSESD